MIQFSQWWMDHSGTFPRLSHFALNILAVPAMTADCERTFSLGMLTVTSQRRSLLGSSVETLQLMKNWIRHGGITVGGGFFRRRVVLAADPYQIHQSIVNQADVTVWVSGQIRYETISELVDM